MDGGPAIVFGELVASRRPRRAGNDLERESFSGVRSGDPVVALDGPPPGAGQRLAVDGAFRPRGTTGQGDSAKT